jgi:hypothetical protein
MGAQTQCQEASAPAKRDGNRNGQQRQDTPFDIYENKRPEFAECRQNCVSDLRKSVQPCQARSPGGIKRPGRVGAEKALGSRTAETNRWNFAGYGSELLAGKHVPGTHDRSSLCIRGIFDARTGKTKERRDLQPSGCLRGDGDFSIVQR